MLACALVTALCAGTAGAVELPTSPPLPEPRPEAKVAVAVPVQRPDGETGVQVAVAIPMQRPVLPGDGKARSTEAKLAPDMPYLPDPRSHVVPAATMPQDEVACRAALRAAGVDFAEARALDDPAGCSVPYPIVVEDLGDGIGFAPKAEMNCATAQALVGFVQETVKPAIREKLGSDLKAIDQASTYVCRPRNGTHKLSEHAFGNAVDIAAFTLADGRRVEVGAMSESEGKPLLDELRKAACGPFKTVLGPGSDADHADHLHLDLAPRRNGGLFCK